MKDNETISFHLINRVTKQHLRKLVYVVCVAMS